MSKPIILVCQGRSGSTSLMRVLNLIEGCNICGENWNMIGNLMDFYENLKKTVNQPGYTRVFDESAYPSWYNVFDFSEVREGIIQLIQKMYKFDSFRIWGFKKIRLGLDGGYERFEYQLNNFIDLFPETRIVFLFREDIEAQIKSGWWAENAEESRNVLLTQLEFFKKYNTDYPSKTYILSMEDMLSLNVNFEKMYDFIEEQYEQEKVRQILENVVDYQKGNEL